MKIVTAAIRAGQLGINPAGDLGPPEMERGEVGHDHAADHDVVEMGDDEIGVVKVNVDRERGEHEAGQPADGEEADEAEDVKQRRVEADAALIKSGGPVEDLHRGGNRDEKTQERKNHAAVNRLAADEHVMAPDEKAEKRDGEARIGDEGVAEDAAAAEAGDDLADHAHAGQDHDVDGGMAVEPEEVLEEQRIAAEIGIEDGNAAKALEAR